MLGGGWKCPFKALGEVTSIRGQENRTDPIVQLHHATVLLFFMDKTEIKRNMLVGPSEKLHEWGRRTAWKNYKPCLEAPDKMPKIIPKPELCRTMEISMHLGNPTGLIFCSPLAHGCRNCRFLNLLSHCQGTGGRDWGRKRAAMA